MTIAFDNKQERYAVGKQLALFLRELAPSCNIEIDKYGYIAIQDAISEIKQIFPNIRVEHINEIVEKDAQKRFEITDNKIRTKAGHKYKIINPSNPIKPPQKLYHGTSPEAANLILESGILRMGKAYVHLSSTIERAKVVGLRKATQPTILTINAISAFEDGINFWKSGQISQDGEIYLSEKIPPIFCKKL